MNKKKIVKRLLQLVDVASSDQGRKRIISQFSKKVQYINGSKLFILQVKKLYQYFIDPKTSKTKKALIGAGLLYFIMPFDLVSDFIPILGYVDDGIAITYIWSLLEKELENYEMNDHIIDITSETEIIEPLIQRGKNS